MSHRESGIKMQRNFIFLVFGAVGGVFAEMFATLIIVGHHESPPIRARLFWIVHAFLEMFYVFLKN